MTGVEIQGELQALVARSWDDVERIGLVSALPDSARRPWRTLVARPEDDPESRVFVFIPEDRLEPAGFGLRSQTVLVEEAVVRVDDRPLGIIARRRGGNLAAAMPLMPQLDLSVPEQLLAGFSSDTDTARAIQSSLLLGASNLEVADLQPEGRSPLIVLKIESPSVFLIERWRDRKVPLFRPLKADGYWIQLGYKHPWERLTLFEPREDLLLLEKSGWSRAARTAFRDAFQLVELTHEGTVGEWATSDRTMRFEIPMRWGVRSNSRAAELWMLNDSDLTRLERLFGVLPHSDLENLQLAVLQDESGVEHFVMREALTGRSRQHLDFGRGYAPVPGLASLLIPVDRQLEPPVPNELLSRLFQTRPRQITLVQPGSDGAMNVLSFSERAFGPVAGLVEHLIRGARHILEPIVSRSVIDLGELASVPERPAIQEPDRKLAEQRPTPGLPVPEVDDVSDELEVEQPEESDESTPQSERPETPPRKEVVLPPKDEEMEAAELAAVNDLEAPSPWLKLARLKARAGRLTDAIACYDHALWVTPGSSLDPDIAAELDELLLRLPADADRAARAHAEVSVFVRNPGDGGERIRRLTHVVELLRDAESVLSKKARWLLWRRVLEVNPDAVEAARLRESILGELSRRGVDELDSFSFIRRCVRNQHERSHLPGAALSLLARMDEWADEISRNDLRLETQAAIAMGRDAAGDTEAVKRFLADNGELAARLPDGSGAAALATMGAAAGRASVGDAFSLFEAALDHLDATKVGYTKDQLVELVLAQVRLGTLLGADTELVGQMLTQISHEKPPRQCLQLYDSAQTLRDLGAAGQVADRVAELLDTDDVRTDSFSLYHALLALQICQGSRPPERAVALKALDIALSLPVKEEHVPASVDIALSGCDEEQLARVQQAIEPNPSLASMLLETSLIRGLAMFGRVDDGLALLSDRLGLVWMLRDSGQIKTVLKRLVTNTADLGRPAKGLDLIESVIDHLDENELDARDLHEVLTECAITVGKLGDQERALDLLERIADSFDELIRGKTSRVTFMFDLLGQIVVQVLSLGSTERGLQLVQRSADTIASRVEGSLGSDHPYYLHLSRIKCAIALISLEQFGEGSRLLEESAHDIGRERMFDGRDRVDLCSEAVEALSLMPIDSTARLDLFELLLETAIGDQRQDADQLRRDMLRKTVDQLVARVSASRLALQKVRGREERLIRNRVLSEELV